MKRTVLFVTAVILVTAVYAVFAIQQKEQTGMGTMTVKSEQMCPMPNCPMCSSMCKSMTEKSMVTTPDGGIIIMAGCKLIKFDKDMNKVKEAQIEIDTEEMQAKMQKMMQSCPICGKMMKMQEGMMPMKSTEKKTSEHPISEHPK